ncbi:MAG TPA: polysaccharide deacetylase family protein, partial [Nitrospira sp.]|nr:polysaccharide deacetylase family protein [Nitrospira sp.]
FVYPLDIGYEPTMSWSQLEELAANGFNVQSHTFSHLNIRKVREGLDKDHYEKLVNAELEISKMVIERKLGSQVDCLAYPYGNYDNTVLKEAIEVGYDAGFTINPRANYPNDAPQELNRYTITPGLGQKAFLKILETSLPRHTHTPGLPSLVRNKMMPDKTHELQGKREIPHDSSDGS